MPTTNSACVAASAANEVAHMESSLVEFTLDNRTIDEVRFGSRLENLSAYTPLSPSYLGRAERCTCSRGWPPWRDS